MPHNFWMVVCNAENFRITQERGFTIQGLKSQHRRKVQRIGNGDRILYYVSHDRQFTATATATTSFFEDNTHIWEKEGAADWPYRFRIKPEVVLDDSQYMDANLLAPRLDYVRRWPPENWYMAFQGNLHLLPKNDFLLIEEEMKKLRFGSDYTPTPITEASQNSRKRKSGSRGHHRRNRGQGQPGSDAAPNQDAGQGAPRQGQSATGRPPNQRAGQGAPRQGQPATGRPPNQSAGQGAPRQGQSAPTE